MFVSRRGFRFFELLVLIAIIALLMSIVVPVLKRAEQCAQRAVCSTRQYVIYIISSLYVNNHKGRFMFQHGADDIVFNVFTSDESSLPETAKGLFLGC